MMNKLWTVRGSLAALATQMICEKHKRRGCRICFDVLRKEPPPPDAVDPVPAHKD